MTWRMASWHVVGYRGRTLSLPLSLSLSLSVSNVESRGWIGIFGMALIESELFFSRPRRAAPRLLKGSRRRAAAAAAAVDSLKRGRKTRGIS